MIQERLDKIEEKLKQSHSIKESDKTELIALVTKLRTEIADLSKTHSEHAESIVRFAELSAHEAMRNEKNPDLFKLSLEGLTSSVRSFETSHPSLVVIINRICKMISDLGI